MDLNMLFPDGCTISEEHKRRSRDIADGAKRGYETASRTRNIRLIADDFSLEYRQAFHNAIRKYHHDMFKVTLIRSGWYCEQCQDEIDFCEC